MTPLCPTRNLKNIICPVPKELLRQLKVFFDFVFDFAFAWLAFMPSSLREISMSNYSPHKKNPFRLVLTLSFPVFLSYFSLGIVFGILFDHLHQPWYFAPIMSLFAYSGAVQFVTIGIMSQHGSYLLILLSTIFIAARNLFYGLSFLKRFQVTLWKKAILIFTL